MITEGFVKTAEYKVDIKFNVPKRSYRKTWPSLQSYYVQTKIVLSSKKNLTAEYKGVCSGWHIHDYISL